MQLLFSFLHVKRSSLNNVRNLMIFARIIFTSCSNWFWLRSMRKLFRCTFYDSIPTLRNGSESIKTALSKQSSYTSQNIQWGFKRFKFSILYDFCIWSVDLFRCLEIHHFYINPGDQCRWNNFQNNWLPTKWA